MDIEQKFLSFEVNYDLFNLEIQNIHIWDFVRYNILEKIKSEKRYNTAKNKPAKVNFWPHFYQFRAILSNISLYTIPQQNTDILILNHGRRIKDDNSVFADIYTDLIDAELRFRERDTLSLEFPVKYLHHSPHKTENLIYLDILDALSGLSRFNFFINLSKAEKENIHELESVLNEGFQTNIDLVQIFTNAVRKYRTIKSRIRQSLEKTNPKCLLEKKIFIQEANKKNITTIELQHGAVGLKHIAYVYPQNYNITSFANILLTWGTFWQENIRVPRNAKFMTGGFPFLEHKLKKQRRREDLMYSNVLVISQWTIGVDLLEYITHLARINPEIKFHFKLHPLEYENKNMYLTKVVDLNIHVYTSDINSYDFYEFCGIQMGVHSTLLFEGLAFNAITYVVPLPGHQEIISLGCDKFIFLENLEPFIMNISNDRHMEDSSDIWAHNALQKTVQIIEDHI